MSKDTFAISSDYAIETYSDSDIVTVEFSSTPAAIAGTPLGHNGKITKNMTYKEARHLGQHIWGVIVKTDSLI